jgi:hypothetical protein
MGEISNRKFPYFRSFHFHWPLHHLKRISPNRLSISFVAVLMTILGLIDPYISSPYCGSCSQEGAAIHDFFALFTLVEDLPRQTLSRLERINIC